MKTIKVKRLKKAKVIVCVLIVSFLLVKMIHQLNAYIEPQLLALAKQHGGFAINNIAKEVIKDMDYQGQDLMIMNKDEEGNIISIEYDSKKINELLYTALSTIDESLLAAMEGKKDPTTKDIFYQDGIIYEVPIGYFTHFYPLYDKGPKLKVRMKMFNDVTGKIETKTSPYGVNNTVVKVNLIVNVEAQVITYLDRRMIHNKSEIPLIIQIVNGKVPQVLPYVNGST